VEQDFAGWLGGADVKFTDSLRAGLDVEGTLARIKARATVREPAGLGQAGVTGKADQPSRPRLQSLPVTDFGESVAAAVEGDPQAVERLLASIRPLVVRYCRARVGRQERSFASADDVAQEVCLAVLTALPSYRDQGRPFLAFVYGIAQHKVADAHRAASRNRAEPVAEVPDEVEGDVGPEQRALQGELNERMSQLLRVLPEKQREIVVLRVVVGLSAEETADAVGSTPGAVRVAQHRALARLRKVLAAEEVI
jgi:RNA polymerase sigma-70 factor (ECF subfamily)